MINGRAIVHASRDDIFGDFIRLKIGFHTPGNRLVIARPVEWVEIADHEPAPPEAMLDIPTRSHDGPPMAQALMDALWNLGMRPSDIGTPGHLAATQKHLEDFRTIAFKLLDTTKP